MTEREFEQAWKAEPRRTPYLVALASAKHETGYTLDEWIIGQEAGQDRRLGIDYNSYGLFQFNSRWYPDASQWSVAKQMRMYDDRMAPVIAREGIRTGFRKWNGSGADAEIYADSLMVLYGQLGGRTDEPVEGVVFGPPSPIESTKQAGFGGIVLLIGGVVCFIWLALRRRSH